MTSRNALLSGAAIFAITALLAPAANATLQLAVDINGTIFTEAAPDLG